MVRSSFGSPLDSVTQPSLTNRYEIASAGIQEDTTRTLAGSWAMPAEMVAELFADILGFTLGVREK
jgi:hypothetical protein